MQQDELILRIHLELPAEFMEFLNQHVRRVLREIDFLLYQFADCRQLLADGPLPTKILLRDFQCNRLHLQREFSQFNLVLACHSDLRQFRKVLQKADPLLILDVRKRPLYL